MRHSITSLAMMQRGIRRCDQDIDGCNAYKRGSGQIRLWHELIHDIREFNSEVRKRFPLTVQKPAE